MNKHLVEIMHRFSKYFISILTLIMPYNVQAQDNDTTLNGDGFLNNISNTLMHILDKYEMTPLNLTFIIVIAAIVIVAVAVYIIITLKNYYIESYGYDPLSYLKLLTITFGFAVVIIATCITYYSGYESGIFDYTPIMSTGAMATLIILLNFVGNIRNLGFVTGSIGTLVAIVISIIFAVLAVIVIALYFLSKVAKQKK